MAVLLRTLLRRAPPPQPSLALLASKSSLLPSLPSAPFHSPVPSTQFPSNRSLDPLLGGKVSGASNPLHSLFAATGMQFPSLPYFLEIGDRGDACIGDANEGMLWADSVKRKRKAKMNKHKHQKRQKLLRKKT